jgi:hypothetical protein
MPTFRASQDGIELIAALEHLDEAAHAGGADSTPAKDPVC